jgi:hypothetical protein
LVVRVSELTDPAVLAPDVLGTRVGAKASFDAGVDVGSCFTTSRGASEACWDRPHPPARMEMTTINRELLKATTGSSRRHRSESTRVIGLKARVYECT